jgi:hypothetical protein
LICITIDTDPDGLAGKTFNREALEWRGLENIGHFLNAREKIAVRWGSLPITWFVRADGQLRDILGSPLYLFEKFEVLWREAIAAQDELGWHPHLYRHSQAMDTTCLVTDPQAAVEELQRLWAALMRSSFRFESFRNGEGWHHRTTFETIESCGFRWDSTAVPGRRGPAGHPMDWMGTPNHPYFPSREDIRLPGKARAMIEIPMNTWSVKAPYDLEPRLRYINPAVHSQLFETALRGFRENLARPFGVWNMILHPDEMLAGGEPDLLYARSPEVVCHNIGCFASAVQEAGHQVEFVTVSRAGREWLRLEGNRDSVQ